ncbi:MAG: hypothetical protein K2G55_19715 [Lachnospiraceae bacterium]|nr:hypothetical protein [Lachnospiraceae bacterium]
MTVKGTNEKEFIENIIRILIWFLIYGGVVVLIYFQIEHRFGINIREQEMANSLQKYYKVMRGQLYVIAAFSAVWWMMALMRCTRYFFERNTFLIAMVFIVLLGVLNTMICVPNRSVQDAVKEYTLNYGLAFSPVFCFNLFCIPPRTVQTVLLGSSVRRWVIGSIMMLVAICIILYR